MTGILFFVVGVALGMWIKGKSAKTFMLKHVGKFDEMREEAKEALAERTEKRKEKILEMMRNAAVHQKELETCDVVDHKSGITRADVEKLLDVSEGTARKYLNELESENKIKQVGDTGRDVYYILN